MLTGLSNAVPIAGGARGATLAVVVYILLINGIVGPVRDLKNDRAHGARTTAIALGILLSGRGVFVPFRAAVYTAGLHAVFVSLCAPLIIDANPLALVLWGLCALGSTAVMFTAWQCRSNATRLGGLGAAYTVSALALLIASGLHDATTRLQVSVGCAFALPVAVWYARNSRRVA